MLAFRNLSRFLPLTHHLSREIIVKQSLIVTSAKLPQNQYINNQQIRNYAKKKNEPKVQINEEQLESVINMKQMKTQMDKVLETMKDEFVKNLSLRSTTGAIETLKIEVDGKDLELQEIAQVIRKNPKTIVVNLIGFPQLIPQVLKALDKSGMNLNPQQDGTTVFVPVPKVTKEHREKLAKNAKALFIKCRDGIKDVQNSFIKKIKNQKTISEDLNRNLQKQVTAFSENYIVEADKILQAKQSELLREKE
jgi:ribosome recycling factor